MGIKEEKRNKIIMNAVENEYNNFIIKTPISLLFTLYSEDERTLIIQRRVQILQG